MAMDFQDQEEKQGRNPFNYNVLKGGQVDPGSKLYQRSIAGREKLSEMLQRLWDQGTDEADVFMAGVKALTSRDKGYVGAYLDSKNPGRRYQDNEAKAITDQVMSDLGIGDHPGARLTRPKDGEGKEERKTSNQMRGAFGPSQAGGPPRKAMPVGQQRKLGKRASTGQPVEDSTRPSQEEERQKRAEGKQDYYYPKTDVQRKYMDIMKNGVKDIQSRVDSGQITAEQAVVETSKLKDRAMAQAGKEANEVRRYKGDLTKKEQEQADKKQQRTDEMRQRIAEQKGLRDQEAAAGPETEETSAPEFINRSYIADYFKKLATTYKGEFDENILEDLISKTLEDNNIEDEVNQDIARHEILKRFDNKRILGGGRLSRFASWSGPINKPADLEDRPKETNTAPEPSNAPAEKTAAPEPEAPAPAKPETAPASAPEPKAPAADKQTQATDEEVMRRATLGGGKRPATPAPAPSGGGKRQPEPNPWEQEGPAPRGIPETAAPAAKQPAALPPGRSKRGALPEEKLGRGGKSKGRAPGGGFNITPKDLRAVKEKIAKSTSPEQIKKEIEQGTFFPAGLITDTADTNPLEGGSAARPEPDVPYRTAQERGDEPATAGRGQAGQGSLMKMRDGEMTTEARSDLKKGQKPKPTSKPAQKKRTKAETQEIQKRGSEELAKTQETNRKLEAMTQRMANSPAIKSEEMRNWINNDLDRLLKSFTPAEKTEDPWEQEGPEVRGIPEPAAQSPSPQRALAGQPGPRGLLPPGKKPQAPPPSSGRRTKTEGDEIRKRGQETLEQLQRGAATERRMANSPVAKREDEINRRGEEALREIQNSPAPRKGRRTKAEGDEIRKRGQEALEQIRGEARRGREVQSRMANSPAATGEAPSNPREAEITRRGEEALRSEVYGNIQSRPGMTNREANRIMREGGYTQPRPGLDAAARAVTEGMDRHDAARKNLPKQVRRAVPKFNSAEYQEFAQSIRSIMR